MTAIEWLEEQLFELRNPTLNQIEILNQAKEIEKQQIIDSANHGANFESSPFKDAEDYYNQTFNK